MGESEDHGLTEFFLRVGEVPDGERSRVGAWPNHFAGLGRKTDAEAGVSVYQVEKCPERGIWKVTDCSNWTSVVELVALLYARKREAWIVTGTPVLWEHLSPGDQELHEWNPTGYVFGIDGEILLRDVVKVSEVAPWDFYVPGCHSPWEDPEAYDDQAPSM